MHSGQPNSFLLTKDVAWLKDGTKEHNSCLHQQLLQLEAQTQMQWKSMQLAQTPNNALSATYLDTKQRHAGNVLDNHRTKEIGLVHHQPLHCQVLERTKNAFSVDKKDILLENVLAKNIRMVDHLKSNPLAKLGHNKPITKIVGWSKKQKMLYLHHHSQ
jgi:hypothetical protein